MNIGILGFAHNHVRSYCTRWQADPSMGIAVVAGWDHDTTRAEDACSQFDIPARESAEALLADNSINAVVIAAETSLHADLAVRAAEAGKAIILQKPMALTLEQADAIVDAVAANNVPFTIAWQMRVDEQNLKMKELIQDGAQGKILMVRRRHGLNTPSFPNFDTSWHVDPDYNRDIWADDAAHAIDFVYWLMGLPTSVTCELGSLVNPRVPNDHGTAVFRYADGSFAEVSSSFTCIAGENTTEIIGEKGVIIQNYGDAPSANIPRPQGGICLKWFLAEAGEWTVADMDIGDHGDRTFGMAAPLADFLHGKRQSIATAEEGRTVLRMTLACYDSDTGGKRVEL